ncbi:MAG: hypothetical protein KY476_23635, partial [Planctomycetes bacterium]|nr:hypothetical protein [Planctomycetota bacterium]
MTRYSRWICTVSIVVASLPAFAADEAAPEYAKDVHPVFRKYCVACHDAEEANGGLVIDDFAKLMRGGESGLAIVPGDAENSRLIVLLEKRAEPFMPPEGSEGPTREEIALLKAWIAAGARGPDGKLPLVTLTTPEVKPSAPVRRAVHSAAFSPDGRFLAIGRYGVVEILDGQTLKALRTLEGHTGHASDVGFSADGRLLIVAAGEPGLYGQATLWNTDDWTQRAVLRGHRDSLYAAALSPDGSLLATGGYDQNIVIWNVESGESLRTLEGHNGPVFDLAFRPDGKLLASASGDRTVKLWDPATGERIETLGQPEKDQYALCFSPDGALLAAGGVDNRIRIWRISDTGREGTNPLLYARFAHEQPIIELAFTPDRRSLISSAEDRTVKFWETGEFTQVRSLAGQADWPAALAVSPDSRTLVIGRMDGSVTMASLGSAAAAGQRSEPLDGLPLPDPHHVDAATEPEQLPLIVEVEPNDEPGSATPLSVPGRAGGVLSPAAGRAEDVDLYRITAVAGQAWIVETLAARETSPADTRVEVLDAQGRPLERILLRAVRDSYITFRPIDSSQTQARLKNWEEMDLNQFLYMDGEVVKLFRAPQGPDSGYEFYPIGGKRRLYFDTSAVTHALEEPVYIVEPYRPGAEVVDNGLPVFPVYYENDDDALRKLGNDSRLTFIAPADGEYLVRVTDVRGFGGADYKYTLVVRPPQPGFTASLSPKT